jgi:hypothetical protein
MTDRAWMCVSWGARATGEGLSRLVEPHQCLVVVAELRMRIRQALVRCDRVEVPWAIQPLQSHSQASGTLRGRGGPKNEVGSGMRELYLWK